MSDIPEGSRPETRPDAPPALVRFFPARKENAMKALIVYCHPSENSMTGQIRDAFLQGIADAGNEAVVSDLYKMNFRTDMSEAE